MEIAIAGEEEEEEEERRGKVTFDSDFSNPVFFVLINNDSDK